MESQDLRSILVVGAKGMLGTEVMEVLGQRRWVQTLGGSEVQGCDIEEVDITDPQNVGRCFDRVRPQLVINCAAYTDVDGCESHREQAWAVNGAGCGHLARACGMHNSKLVHVSTDFVFDGKNDRPYRVEDAPNPVSVYGESKRAGEEAIQANMEDYIIVRTSWLFGKHGKNFVSTICRAAREREFLEVVDDQIGTPTYSVDLAEALLHLAAVEGQGIFHFSNEGQCSWFEFAGEIVRQFGLPTEVRPTTSEKFPRPAPRPAWSVMDISRYKQTTGQSVRSWRDALADYRRQW